MSTPAKLLRGLLIMHGLLTFILLPIIYLLDPKPGYLWSSYINLVTWTFNADMILFAGCPGFNRRWLCYLAPPLLWWRWSRRD